MRKRPYLPADRAIGELPRWVRLSAVVAGILALAIAALRLAFMDSLQQYRSLFVGTAILCFLWAAIIAIVGVVGSPRLVRARLQSDVRQQRQGKRQSEEEQARELRGESYEARRSWDRFARVAGEFISFYDSEAKPEGWQENLRAPWEASMLAAYQLFLPQDRAAALRLVGRFNALVGGSDPNGDFGVPACDLRDFLFRRGRDYDDIRSGARAPHRAP